MKLPLKNNRKSLKLTTLAFTLIELLATIVIIAVVAVITVPIITGIIDNVKRAAFTRSVESSLKAFELLRSQSQDSISRVDVTDDRLPLEHNNFLSGTIMTINKGEIEAYYLYDGTYCGSGTLGNITVKKGVCEESFDVIANFIMKNYILTIDPNGGTWKDNSDIQNINILMDEVNDLENPIRAGHNFTGWDMSVTGELENEDSGFLRTTLKAKWVANTYKLLINPNGGKYDNSELTKIINIKADETTELLEPVREKYAFNGWEITGENSSITGNQFKMGSEDTIITAKWILNTYNLTINPNGGIYDGESEAKVVELNVDETYTLLTPLKTGYTFDGWEVVGEGSNVVVNQFTMGNSASTVTAKWKANTYTIAYNCNGGSGGTANSTHTYGIANNLTNNGCYKISAGTNGMVYQFIGWSTNSGATSATYTNGQSVINVASSGTATLYAVWKNLFSYTASKNVISDGSGNWRIKFLTNGTLTMNYGASIDVFLVGGGGGGGAFGYPTGDGGGGGGYTKTVKKVSVSAIAYSIVIGAGGPGETNWNTSQRSSGGTTTAFGYSANGGQSGHNRLGGNGGSGGGGYPGDAGGTNGGNGVSNDPNSTAGTGQGKTTREFGDSSGTLYASGGRGGIYYATAYSCVGAANTGNGGGGAGSCSGGVNGGSGIVIIRNAR